MLEGWQKVPLPKVCTPQRLAPQPGCLGSGGVSQAESAPWLQARAGRLCSGLGLALEGCLLPAQLG